MQPQITHTTIANSGIIPANEKGKQNDLEHSESFTSREEAAKCFVRAYKRMFNPKVWHKLCGFMSAELALVNPNGEKERDLAEINDYYRIDIPGPGTTAGDGYDWVKVDAIEEHHDATAETEWMAMRLRPAPNPAHGTSDVAHFFQDSATSTFIISRTGNTVTASYHGRNELPNNHTSSAIDNLRNAVVTSGAFAGFSEAHWSTLIKEFLQAEIGG